MNERLIEIPGYQVHERLGKSDIADVYLASQVSLHRKVAVKVLHATDDEAFCQRFVQEARAIAALHHPSIIIIHDSDRLPDGRCYLAMEYLPLGDLGRYEGDFIEPQKALRIVRQIAGGLAVVHGKGLVHRDLKPANILFRDDGTAVITDFGVAKVLDPELDLTQYGIAADDSPSYGSPEQAQCRPLDARSDIYSLGVILLEMLTGTNPFRAESYTQTVMNHLQMPVPRLSPVLQDYQALLDRMLAKAPEDRFVDCDALLAALDAFYAPLPEPPAPGSAVSPEVAPTTNGARRRKRKPKGSGLPGRLLGAVLGVVLLAGLAGVAYQAYRDRQINEHLTYAERHLADGRLVEPPQDNADYYFRQVLGLDPDNAQAQDGLERVWQALIERYLGLAEQRLEADRLLQPENDSATSYFRRVLALDPQNLLAQAGLNRVAQRFIEQAEKAYGRKEYALALQYIRSGLEVEPGNAALCTLEEGHQRRIQVAQSRTAKRPTARTTSRPAERSEPNPIKRLWNTLFD